MQTQRREIAPISLPRRPGCELISGSFSDVSSRGVSRKVAYRYVQPACPFRANEVGSYLNNGHPEIRPSVFMESRSTHSLLRTTFASNFPEIVVNNHDFERSEFGAIGVSISLAAQRDMGSFRNRGHLGPKVICPSAAPSMCCVGTSSAISDRHGGFHGPGPGTASGGPRSTYKPRAIP
jgi:hypothetical protein